MSDTKNTPPRIRLLRACCDFCGRLEIVALSEAQGTARICAECTQSAAKLLARDERGQEKRG